MAVMKMAEMNSSGGVAVLGCPAGGGRRPCARHLIRNLSSILRCALTRFLAQSCTKVPHHQGCDFFLINLEILIFFAPSVFQPLNQRCDPLFSTQNFPFRSTLIPSMREMPGAAHAQNNPPPLQCDVAPPTFITSCSSAPPSMPRCFYSQERPLLPGYISVIAPPLNALKTTSGG